MLPLKALVAIHLPLCLTPVSNQLQDANWLNSGQLLLICFKICMSQISDKTDEISVNYRNLIETSFYPGSVVVLLCIAGHFR